MDDIEDRDKFNRFCQCDDIHSAVWGFLNQNPWKHDESDEGQKSYDIRQEGIKQLVKILDENNVNMDLWD